MRDLLPFIELAVWCGMAMLVLSPRVGRLLGKSHDEKPGTIQLLISVAIAVASTGYLAREPLRALTVCLRKGYFWSAPLPASGDAIALYFYHGFVVLGLMSLPILPYVWMLNRRSERNASAAVWIFRIGVILLGISLLSMPSLSLMRLAWHTLGMGITPRRMVGLISGLVIYGGVIGALWWAAKTRCQHTGAPSS